MGKIKRSFSSPVTGTAVFLLVFGLLRLSDLWLHPVQYLSLRVAVDTLLNLVAILGGVGLWRRRRWSVYLLTIAVAAVAGGTLLVSARELSAGDPVLGGAGLVLTFLALLALFVFVGRIRPEWPSFH